MLLGDLSDPASVLYPDEEFKVSLYQEALHSTLLAAQKQNPVELELLNEELNKYQRPPVDSPELALRLMSILMLESALEKAPREAKPQKLSKADKELMLEDGPLARFRSLMDPEDLL